MSNDDAMESRLLRVEQERDLYRRILQLGRVPEIPAFLEEALALVVSATGAQQGYLEIEDRAGETDSPVWSTSHSCSSEKVADIRVKISRGIIAQARASGEIVSTASALLDPRFEERASVQADRIDAVLCAPLGGERILGVVYLQGRNEPGTFDADDSVRIELLAAHLGPLAERLLARHYEVTSSDPTIEYRKRIRADSIVGKSAALATMLEQVALVAPLDIDLLLTGESGTGKTDLARVIHENSRQAGMPFVEVNCGAIAETLIENELFGHAAGAYTDARQAESGKVAAAEGGTLLLDEIGDLSVGAQAKLLQLLQSKTYFPLGSTQGVRAKVRVIAATNVDLQKAIERKEFRQDLFYRLEVLPIHVPSLAERQGDIAVLADHFCAQACARHGFVDLKLSMRARRALEVSEWPGNIRQLAFSIERGAIRSAGAEAREIGREHLFPDSAGEDPVRDAELGLPEATRRFQAELVAETLRSCDWNVTEAARRLQIARSHVYNLINAFGLERVHSPESARRSS